MRRSLMMTGILLFVLTTGGWVAAEETTTTSVTGPTSTTSVIGPTTTSTTILALPTLLFSEDAFDEANAGVDSHPNTDPLEFVDTNTQGLTTYVTRGQLAIRLADALGLQGVASSDYSDLTGEDECFAAVGALQEKKLLTGVYTSRFFPDQLVSREQALVWITDALGYRLNREGDSTVPFRFSYFESADEWLGGFKDRSMISDGLARGVANAYRLGVVEVPSDGYLYPFLPLTQADLSAMLSRALSGSISAKSAPPEAVSKDSDYPELTLRDEGPLVWYLEYQLAALKYRPGAIDGIFDIRTRDAVYAFQKVERLDRDGIVGDTFWQHLAVATTPEPREEREGTRVEADLTRQVLFMITDNEVWKIVHISSGKATTQTLTGHFEVEKKMPRWLHDSYNTTMYYSSFFDVDHRLAIHGYSQVPVWAASHGCIRCPNWMAKELYEEMPMGTPVYVYK